MTDVVIVAYRPKEGRSTDLEALTREHVPMLRRLRLATDRPAIVLRARDGTIVEVFEWADGAMPIAHSHPDVLAMWDRYAVVSDYVPLSKLAEAQDLFALFSPVAP